MGLLARRMEAGALLTELSAAWQVQQNQITSLHLAPYREATVTHPCGAGVELEPVLL